jgi:hypothetical protein
MSEPPLKYRVIEQKRDGKDAKSIHTKTKEVISTTTRRRRPKVDAKRKVKSLVPENYPEVPKLKLFEVKAEENKLPNGFFIICEGARRSGKSIFLKYLLFHYKDMFDEAVVMSETPHNGFWQPIVSNKWVHNGWDPFVVEKILAEQAKEIEESKKHKEHKPKQILLVLDDIVGDRKHIHEDTTLNRLAVQGRHFNVSICLTTQEPHAIGTSLRNNADFVVIFQQKSARAKKSVCDDFLNFKLDFEWQSRDLLKTYTTNHDAIVVKMWDLKKGTSNCYLHVPESMTYDAKTEKVKVPDFQLGCIEQQRLAKTESGSIPLFS